MKRKTINFPSKKSMGRRPWGKEDLLVLASGKYTLKLLEINAGSKGGLQYHRKKDEAGYIIFGKLLIRYEDHSGKLRQKTLKQGDWFHFPNGSVHQEEAITKVKILEVSTPYKNDRVRVEKRHGIQDISGMPTTPYKKIVKL